MVDDLGPVLTFFTRVETAHSLLPKLALVRFKLCGLSFFGTLNLVHSSRC